MSRTSGRGLFSSWILVDIPSRRRGTLTCAKRDDDGARTDPNYDAAGAGQGAICRVEDPQDAGVVALEFVKCATLWTLEFTP